MNKHKSPIKAYKNLEFLNSREARVIRILSEYLEPLKRLRDFKVNNTVLFFGSARISSESNNSQMKEYYWEAEKLSYMLAQWAIDLKKKGKNFVICTGGGGGFMEAANRGASRAGGKSIGMNISIPEEQEPNHYISPELCFEFHYFFMRKFWLAYKAKAIIAFPGGFGTLDEIFEILTLVQTKKVNKKDIFIMLYGEEYWKELVDFDVMVQRGTISPEDLDLFRFCSDPDKAFRILKENLGQHL
ncbi:MAG: TIGR00730 family Rossman fold protein [Candidatus Aminicenantes bacterium]|nr:TIGR00730 family Rossman fold protein [Candidatus Aminicenantes bacterium]